MNKKKIGIIVGGVIGICIIFTCGYYFAKNTGNNKNTSNKITTSQSVAQQKPKEENKIDDFRLGVLTKEEFENALEKGKEYKGKKTAVEGINQITEKIDNSISEKGIMFLITTPYKMVIDISKELTERYIDVNNNNFKNEYNQQKEKSNIDLNTFRCMACINGTDMDFAKYTHMVLRVYGKNETKELQPIKFNNTASADVLMGGKLYYNSIIGIFNAKDVIKLNPQKLEIIVIYPDGKEVKQSFDYNQLNQL